MVTRFYCRMLSMVCCMAMCSLVQAQSLSAVQVLKKCIQKHDPKNKWKKFQGQFDMSIIRDGHDDRFFTVGFDNDRGSFFYAVNNDSIQYKQSVTNDKYQYIFDGSEQISENIIKKYQLTDERTKYLKEVYDYLFGVPMRLLNDVNFMDDKVSLVDFNGKKCYQLTFEYLPKKENETWYFFIDTDSFTIEGYQFFNTDIAKDGEYIYLNNYAKMYDLWIPKTKIWYWNKDNSLFRRDNIIIK